MKVEIDGAIISELPRRSSFRRVGVVVVVVVVVWTQPRFPQYYNTHTHTYTSRNRKVRMGLGEHSGNTEKNNVDTITFVLFLNSIH